MANQTLLTASAILLLAALVPATAYHIDPTIDATTLLSPGDWAFAAGSVVITCESNGASDDLNDNTVALPGGGGLCTTGENDATGTRPFGQGTPGSGIAASIPPAGDYVRLDLCNVVLNARTLNEADYRYTDTTGGLADTEVAPGDADEAAAVSTATNVLRVDPTPTGVDITDELYADEDASGTVSDGDFRYTDISSVGPYSAFTDVYGGDAEIGDSFDYTADYIDSDADAVASCGDDYYYDGDNTGNVTDGDIRLADDSVVACPTDADCDTPFDGSVDAHDNAPTGADSGDDLYADSDSSGDVSVGDIHLNGAGCGDAVVGADDDVGASVATDVEVLLVDLADTPDAVDSNDDLYADMDGGGFVAGGGQFVPSDSESDCDDDAGITTDTGFSTDDFTFTARLAAFQCVVPAPVTAVTGATADYAFYYDRLYAWYSYGADGGDGWYTPGDDSGAHTGDTFAFDNGDDFDDGAPGPFPANGMNGDGDSDNEDAFHGHVTVFLSTNAAEHVVAPATGSVLVEDVGGLPGAVTDASLHGGVLNACGGSPAVSGPVARAPDA